MNIINNDIFNCKENILAHQVNHQGVMGAGLALQVKKRFPTVFYRYLDVCKRISWKVIQDAGAVDFIKCGFLENNKEFYVANLFGQRYYGSLHLYPDYEAMKNGFETICRFSVRNNLNVAIPYLIGCGLGKGDWSVVSVIIKDIFENKVEYNIYKLETK